MWEFSIVVFVLYVCILYVYLRHEKQLKELSNQLEALKINHRYLKEDFNEYVSFNKNEMETLKAKLQEKQKPKKKPAIKVLSRD